MSEFHRLLLGLHAQARRIDRDQALLGALGVGANAYPHQVENVHRMVTGTACRWLLADEVGLGKTVQAIMVMRALAAQSPRPLNVALVVPDDLAGQWEEELLCRGHTVAIESGEAGGPDGNLVLRLLRPSRLLADGRIIAEKLDLLIVDEFTKLQVQVRRDLTAAARTIPNVIALTATPALHLIATRRELMALLEPEADRIAQAEDSDILKVLADREALAIERHGVDLKDAGKRRQVEEAYGLFRHLIRTQRTDYPDALPRRIYQPIRLAPTDGDIGRAKTTRAYLDAARATGLGIRRDELLQVGGRSPASLRDRLSTLKRGSSALDAAWQQIGNCIRDEPGDAKLDSLIDHIRSMHVRDPDARIVVVSEDNPTTDYLRDAIEKLADVRVARKRRSISAAEELVAQIAGLKDALDDFISGEAKVLVAASNAREGHNLQFADEIVFYALPWSPPDIQQWIGRIDRLGTKGHPASRRITITPIVIDESIEEQILEVLESTGVFRKSEVFDEAEWGAISKAIGAAADGSGSGTWTDAVREAKSLGETYDAWLQVTRLPPSPRAAVALGRDATFRSRPYAMPIAPLKALPWNWYVMREYASETMIKLAREDLLDVRKRSMGDQQFWTMWYQKKPGPDDFIIADLDAGSSWHRQAYIANRSAIGCPPRPYVVEKDDTNKRRLHFFDHGSALHDGAISAFERQTPPTNHRTEFLVEYPAGHPALQWAGRRLLVATAEVDLSGAISFGPDAAVADLDPDASGPEREARSTAERVALAQFQADRRWMIDLAPPVMLVAIHVEDGNDFIVADAAAPALFVPTLNGKCARQLGKRTPALSPDKLSSARSIASDRLGKLGSDYFRQATRAIRENLQSRLFAAQADADNMVDAARAEVAFTETRSSRPEAIHRAEQRASVLAFHLAEALWETRATRLADLQDAMKKSAQITRQRMFWIVPRAPSEQIP